MDLPAYFESVYSYFQEAERQSSSPSDCYFRFAGKWTVRVRLAHAALHSYFTRAIAHLAVPATAIPDFTICVTDSPIAGQDPPYPIVADTPVVGQVTFLTSSDIRIAFQLFPKRLSLLDVERNLAVYWISDLEQFLWYETCSPFRYLLHWWMAVRQHQTVHAAAVGTADGGVLLIGDGGSGKSSTALNCVKSGLYYIGDDLCLLGMEGSSLFAYSLFNSAKLDTFHGTIKLPEFETHICNPLRPDTEKGTLFLYEHFQDSLIHKLPIRAIVAPKITRQRETTIKPISNQQAVRTVIQSTMDGLVGRDVDDFYNMIRLTKDIPCYELELGNNLSQVAPALKSLLTQSLVSSVPAQQSMSHGRE